MICQSHTAAADRPRCRRDLVLVPCTRLSTFVLDPPDYLIDRVEVSGQDIRVPIVDLLVTRLDNNKRIPLLDLSQETLRFIGVLG